MSLAEKFSRSPDINEAMLNALPHPVMLVAPDGKDRRSQYRGRSFL